MDGSNVVGKRLKGIDALKKVTGEASYTSDIRLPYMLIGRIFRSKYAHAKILNIDVAKAKRLHGIKAIITAEDIPPIRIGRFIKDQPILARQKVRYIGEPVIAIAATDEDTAEEALGLIQVEYEEIPAVFDPLEAMGEDAPIIHEELQSYQDTLPSKRYGNVRNEVRICRGDMEEGWSRSYCIYQDHYTTQPVHHGYIEPHGAVASIDISGRITIWASTKNPFLTRTLICQGLQLPMTKIRIIVPEMGGDFGGKGPAIIEPICAILAQKTHKPVKILTSRKEEISYGYKRHPAIIDLKVGISRDGILLALQGRVVYDAGAYSDSIGGLAFTCANLQGPYRVKAADLTGYSVYTNNVPSTHVRAPGVPQTLFAIESQMNLMAKDLGLDPWEIRLSNGVENGDSTVDGREILSNVGLKKTISTLRQSIGEKKELTRKIGRGIGCAQWVIGSMAERIRACGACVKINEDGTATLLTGVTDQGGGQRTILAQIVAEELGLELTDVCIIAADTEITPYDGGSGGSTVTYRAGNIVKWAAEEVKEKLLRLAAAKLEADPEDLELGKKRIYVKGSPDRAVDFKTLGTEALTSEGGPILGTGMSIREKRIATLNEAKTLVDAPCYGAHMVEVEVDVETGLVYPLKYIACHDVGFSLNPSNVEGQIEGAVVFGMGYALTEQILSDRGRHLTRDFLDYKMLTASDVPHIQSIIVEEPSRFGPHGAKGIGEPPITPVAAAIANAVYDAVGVRVKDLPLTPEKVLKALKSFD